MDKNSELKFDRVENECLKGAIELLKSALAEHSITTGTGGLPTNQGVSGNMLITQIAHDKYNECVKKVVL